MANDYIDPYADSIAKQRALLAQPFASKLSQDDIAQRRALNERLQQLGLLGMLSGDDGLGTVGGNLVKQAAKDRDVRVSDMGAYDPITGEFMVHPEVQRQRAEAELQRLQERSAEGQRAWQAARQAAQERGDQAQQQREFLASEHALTRAAMAQRGEPLMPIVGPDGNAIYAPRSQAAGQRVPPTAAAGNPSEDERKAAGWLQQAQLAFANMKAATAADPNAAKPSGREMAIGAVPGIGRDAAYAAMTPARQQFTTAASSLSEAVLRAATGAGVNKDEALQKVQELTPRFGEDPKTTAMKEQMAGMYINSLQARAGRAAPQPTGAQPQVFKKALAGAGSGGWSITRE